MRIFLGTAVRPNSGPVIQISAILRARGRIKGWYTQELVHSVNGSYWRDTGVDLAGKTMDDAWSYLMQIWSYQTYYASPIDLPDYRWNREENYILPE